MYHKTSSIEETADKKVKREDSSRKEEIRDFLSTELPKNGNDARR
jgi:hypothetical protein